MEISTKSGAGVSRAAVSLTHKALENLKPAASPYRVPDTRTKGLAARVATSGAISWDCSFRISGTDKVRRLSLGAWPGDVSLDAARDRANELTRAARAGRDLLVEEAASKCALIQRTTVSAMIDEYVKRRIHGRLRTADQIESRLKRGLATLLDWAAADVRRRDIRSALDVVADAGFLREAEQRRLTIGKMWKWAVSADICETNVTADLPHYDGGTPRTRILTADEIVALWNWLRISDMPAAHADVLRLELLLGARCGEIGGMSLKELDASQRLWMLPGTRTKNGKARITPLVGQAWDIVARRLQTPTSGSLFPTDNGKPLTAAHVGHVLLNRPLPIEKFTTHDLRRTLASGMCDMGISLETIAAVIGHTGGKVDVGVFPDAATGTELATLRRHYIHTDRLEPKRRALEAWSQHIGVLLSGTETTSTIVPFTTVRDPVAA